MPAVNRLATDAVFTMGDATISQEELRARMAFLVKNYDPIMGWERAEAVINKCIADMSGVESAPKKTSWSKRVACQGR